MPVAEGSATTLEGLAKTHVADFVHGSDGFGNTQQAAVEVCVFAGTLSPTQHAHSLALCRG